MYTTEWDFRLLGILLVGIELSHGCRHPSVCFSSVKIYFRWSIAIIGCLNSCTFLLPVVFIFLTCHVETICGLKGILAIVTSLSALWNYTSILLNSFCLHFVEDLGQLLGIFVTIFSGTHVSQMISVMS